MNVDWKDIVVLLQGNERTGFHASELLCDIILPIHLPDVFHVLSCTPFQYLQARDWMIRNNTATTLQKLMKRYQKELLEQLQNNDSSDGMIFQLKDIHLLSILSQDFQPLLAGSVNMKTNELTTNLYHKSWLTFQRRQLIKRLGLASRNQMEVTTAFTHDITAELIEEADITLISKEDDEKNEENDENDENVSFNIDNDLTLELWFTRILRLMIVGILDPVWEIRHGYVMGLSNIVLGFSSSSSQLLHFPRFLSEDIICSCLFVLILDQFLDIDAAGNTSISPVKEMTGQLISICLKSLNNPDYNNKVFDILLDMSNYHKEWHVQFGGLIALKYFAVTIPVYENNSSLMKRLFEMLLSTLSSNMNDIVIASLQVIGAVVKRMELVVTMSNEMSNDLELILNHILHLFSSIKLSMSNINDDISILSDILIQISSLIRTVMTISQTKCNISLSTIHGSCLYIINELIGCFTYLIIMTMESRNSCYEKISISINTFLEQTFFYVSSSFEIFYHTKEYIDHSILLSNIRSNLSNLCFSVLVYHGLMKLDDSEELSSNDNLSTIISLMNPRDFFLRNSNIVQSTSHHFHLILECLCKMVNEKYVDFMESIIHSYINLFYDSNYSNLQIKLSETFVSMVMKLSSTLSLGKDKLSKIRFLFSKLGMSFISIFITYLMEDKNGMDERSNSNKKKDKINNFIRSYLPKIDDMIIRNRDEIISLKSTTHHLIVKKSLSTQPRFVFKGMTDHLSNVTTLDMKDISHDQITSLSSNILSLLILRFFLFIQLEESTVTSSIVTSTTIVTTTTITSSDISQICKHVNYKIDHPMFTMISMMKILEENKDIKSCIKVMDSIPPDSFDLSLLLTFILFQKCIVSIHYHESIVCLLQSLRNKWILSEHSIIPQVIKQLLSSSSLINRSNVVVAEDTVNCIMNLQNNCYDVYPYDLTIVAWSCIMEYISSERLQSLCQLSNLHEIILSHYIQSCNNIQSIHQSQDKDLQHYNMIYKAMIKIYSIFSHRIDLSHSLSHSFWVGTFTQLSTITSESIINLNNLIVCCELIQEMIVSIHIDVIIKYYEYWMSFALFGFTHYHQSIRKSCTTIFRFLVPLSPLFRGKKFQLCDISNSDSSNSNNSTESDISVSKNVDKNRMFILNDFILLRISPPSLLDSMNDKYIIDYLRNISLSLPSVSLSDQSHNSLPLHLRQYQWDGISFITHLRRCGLGALLADEMGLGKTIQALTVIAVVRVEKSFQTNPSIVICPASLILHWQLEISKFFPNHLLKPLVLKNSEDITQLNHLQSCDVLILSYDMLRRILSSDSSSTEIISNTIWETIILDEAHMMKNPFTRISQSIFSLKSLCRIALTGTPIQNHVQELWSLMNFLIPDFLGDYKSFREKFVKPIHKSFKNRSKLNSPENNNLSSSSIFSQALLGITAEGLQCLNTLHKQVLPFILRRTKDIVLKELPKKTIIDIYCPLSSIQQQLYSSFQSNLKIFDQQLEQEILRITKIDIMSSISKQSSISTSKSMSHSWSATIHPFQALKYLQLLCVHPSLVIESKHRQYKQRLLSDNKCSGKMAQLLKLLLDSNVVLTTECVHVDDINLLDHELTTIEKEENSMTNKDLYLDSDSNSDHDGNDYDDEEKEEYKSSKRPKLLNNLSSSSTIQSLSRKKDVRKMLIKGKQTESKMKMATIKSTNQLSEDTSHLLPISTSSLFPTVATHKCLIFCQHQATLNIIEECILKKYFPSIQYARLDGTIPPNTRAQIAQDFNNNPCMEMRSEDQNEIPRLPSVAYQTSRNTLTEIVNTKNQMKKNLISKSDYRILLMTTKACGLGLNLTAADTVIFVEHDYNPFVDLQAMERVHRFGQTKPVRIFRLLAESTIEARIVALQDLKKEVAREIINENSARSESPNKEESLGDQIWKSMSSSIHNPLDKVLFNEDIYNSHENHNKEYDNIDLDKFLSTITRNS